jgi:hypothetical protein
VSNRNLFVDRNVSKKMNTKKLNIPGLKRCFTSFEPYFLPYLRRLGSRHPFFGPRWPSWVLVVPRWPALAFVGLRWSSFVFVGLVALVGLRRLLTPVVGLRWPALAGVGLRWPLLAFVGRRWPSWTCVGLWLLLTVKKS